MKYDWEKEIEISYVGMAAQMELPEGYSVLGVIVASEEDGEAALIHYQDIEVGVIKCDHWQDVLGDATEIYNTAYAETFGSLATTVYKPEPSA